MLVLDQNQITDRGAQYLADALKNNQTLTRLDLEKMQITEAGAQQFAKVLETNKILKELYLPANTIADHAKKALQKKDNRIKFN